MIAQLSYTRSRKRTQNRAVTSQENRLLSAVITRPTDRNPTGYVALWRIGCRRRTRPTHPGRARGDRCHLFPDGCSGLGIRPPARAPRPPLRCQPGGRRWSSHHPFLGGSCRAPRFDARATASLEPDIHARRDYLSRRWMRERCGGAFVAGVPRLGLRGRSRMGRARHRLQPARRPQRRRAADSSSECVERDFRCRRRGWSDPRLNRRPYAPGPSLRRRCRGGLRALARGQRCLRAVAVHVHEDRGLVSLPPRDLHDRLCALRRDGGGNRRLDAFSARIGRFTVGGRGDFDVRLLAGARGGPAPGRPRAGAHARKRDRDHRIRGGRRCAGERADPSRRADRLHRRRPGDRPHLSHRHRVAGQAPAWRRARHVMAVSGLHGGRSRHPGRHRRDDCAIRDRCGPGGAGTSGGWLRRLVLAGVARGGPGYRWRTVTSLTLGRWFGVAMAIVLVGGCAGGATGTGKPPTQSTPSSAAAVATLPCRMPVNLRVDQGGNREVLGYLALPSGVTTDDPTDSIVKVADFPVSGGGTVPFWGTVTSPQLFGVGLGTFSPIAGKWLPAPPELVSPDLVHYTYLHPNGSLRLAAAAGAEIPVANPINLTPLAYAGAGVVLVQNQPASSGLWLLDPRTHAITVITQPTGSDDWREVTSAPATATAGGGTLAYGVNSPGGLGAPPATTVLRANLQAGGLLKTTTVYTADAGTTIALIAADRQGGLLVALTGHSPGGLSRPQHRTKIGDCASRGRAGDRGPPPPRGRAWHLVHRPHGHLSFQRHIGLSEDRSRGHDRRRARRRLRLGNGKRRPAARGPNARQPWG